MNPATNPGLQRGIDLLKAVEGCKLYAYFDQGGVPTIGYGHTHGVKIGDVITQKEADDLLLHDASHFYEPLASMIIIKIGSNQMAALLSFIFNEGITAFRNSTLRRLVNAGKFEGVPDELRRWKYYRGRDGVPKISQGLINRREAEIACWLSA